MPLTSPLFKKDVFGITKGVSVYIKYVEDEK